MEDPSRSRRTDNPIERNQLADYDQPLAAGARQDDDDEDDSLSELTSLDGELSLGEEDDSDDDDDERREAGRADTGKARGSHDPSPSPPPLPSTSFHPQPRLPTPSTSRAVGGALDALSAVSVDMLGRMGGAALPPSPSSAGVGVVDPALLPPQQLHYQRHQQQQQRQQQVHQRHQIPLNHSASTSGGHLSTPPHHSNRSHSNSPVPPFRYSEYRPPSHSPIPQPNPSSYSVDNQRHSTPIPVWSHPPPPTTTSERKRKGEEADGEEEKKKAKRVRPLKPRQDPRKRKGGRLGRLEAMLVKMPLEILGEILSNLPSATLLRLSRTAKIFRNLLLDRQVSKGTWVAALGKDGVWDCAEDPAAADGNGEEEERKVVRRKKGVGRTGFEDTAFGEVMWTALMWDKECGLCGRQKVHKIDYSLRLRVCDTCLKDQLSTKDGHLVKHTNLHPKVWECIPFSTSPIRALTVRGDKYYLETTLLSTSAHLRTLEADDLLAAASSGTLVASEYPASCPSVDKFVEEWKERVPKMEEDTKMMNKWQKSHDAQNVDGKRSMKKEREKSIRQHCVSTGADNVDISAVFSPGSSVWSLIDQPYALTDRVWRKIQHPIFAALTEAKNQREAQVRERAERAERERLESARRAALALNITKDLRMSDPASMLRMPQGGMDELLRHYVAAQQRQNDPGNYGALDPGSYADLLQNSGASNISAMLASLYNQQQHLSGGSGSAGPSNSMQR